MISPLSHKHPINLTPLATFIIRLHIMNYDFQTNWDSMILPVLSLPQIKKSIKKGIKKFIPFSYKGLKYSSKLPPAHYGRSDAWSMHMDEFKERLMVRLLTDGILQPDPNIPSPDAEAEDLDDYFNEDPRAEEYETYKEKVMEPYIRHHEKTSLQAYQMFFACHWWNPTFGLTLAQTVCPLEKWSVLKGELHTTVVNADRTKVFDILFFNPDDPTKGGEFAISQALKKP